MGYSTTSFFLGCFHAQLRKYGFRASMFDKLGECLLDALVVQDCVRGFPEACRGWTLLIAALIDRLRSSLKHLTALPITGNQNHEHFHSN